MRRPLLIAVLFLAVFSAAPALAQGPGRGGPPEGDQNRKGIGVVLGSPALLGLRFVTQSPIWGLQLESTNVTLKSSDVPVNLFVIRIDARRAFLRTNTLTAYAFGGGTYLSGEYRDVGGSFVFADFGVGADTKFGYLGVGAEFGMLAPLKKAEGFEGVGLVAELNLIFWF